MLLADQGADVLRIHRVESVERGRDPGGIPVIDRNRRSVGVDLKQPAASRPSCGSSSRPTRSSRVPAGVTERLGVGPEPCLARNPRLVYARMTGWGQDAPSPRPPGTTSTTSRSPARSRTSDAPAPSRRRAERGGDFGGGGMLLAVRVVLRCRSRRTRRVRARSSNAAMVDGTATLMSMMWGLRALGAFDEEARGATSSTPAPRSTTPTNAPTARSSRWGPSSRSSTPSLLAKTGLDREGASRPDGPRRMAAPARAVHRAVQDQEPRRLVRVARGQRRVLRAGADH